MGCVNDHERETIPSDGGAAVLERAAARGARGGGLPAGGHVCALHAGQRAGSPLCLRQRRQRGGLADLRPQGGPLGRGADRPLQRPAGGGLCRAGHPLRHLRRDPPGGFRRVAQPHQPVVLQGQLRQGLLHQEDHRAALRRAGQPVPARPLREGHLLSHPARRQALRLHRRLRRPVRAVRELHRPHAADQPGQHHHRNHADPPSDHPLVHAAAALRRAAQGLAGGQAPAGRRQPAVARNGTELLAGPDPPGPARAGHDPRPALGRARAAGRPRRPGQGALRLVRRPHRLRVLHRKTVRAGRRLEGLRALVEEPGLPHRALHRRGQHRLPRPDLAGRAHGRGQLPVALAGGGQQLPEHQVPRPGRAEDQQEPRHRGVDRRVPQALRAGPAALLPDRHRPREAADGLRCGRLLGGQQRHPGQHPGQLHQPHPDLRGPLLRRPGAAGGSARGA